MRTKIFLTFLVFVMLLSVSLVGLIAISEEIEPISERISSAPLSFAGGNGSMNNPFQIADVIQLQNISANLSAQYILVNDIDATETATWNFGNGFAPIGSSSSNFIGTLDGKGFKLFNLTVNRSGLTYCGMFGYTNNKFKLSNLTIINPWISGLDWTSIIGYMEGGNISYVTVLNATIAGRDVCGGLVADIGTFASVKNSSSNGSVSGDDYIGGLAAFSRGTIEHCYSTCRVKALDDYAGGFIGYNLDDKIRNCYATGDVSGDRFVGGFTGYGKTSIKHCYSLGKPIGNLDVGGFVGGAETYAHIACFWDEDSSGTSTGWGSGTPTGITGNTNTEMKTKSTFTSAGWDFNNTWYIVDGGTPPFLQSLGADNGIGTKLYPFLIDDIYDLQAMNENLNVHYALVNDIDASETHKWNWNGTAYRGFTPVAPDTDPGTSGYQGTMFKGTFNGNGKAIHNLYINRPNEDYIGLFGVFSNLPGPYNVSLINVNITGNTSVGSLMGVSFSGAIADKCYVSGVVRGNWNVGGLVGYCRNYIYNSNTNCTVIGYSRVGGLVGYLQLSTVSPAYIYNCYSEGKVIGEDHIGGLIGYADDAYFIRRCYSISTVQAGGLSPQNAGGLLGYHAFGTVEDCYSTGSVTGGNYAGGFLGRNFNGVVLNCSSSGYVSGNPTFGGFIGYNQTGGSGIIERCFFDTQTSGTSSGFGFGSSTEVVGRTTTQMMTKTTFTNAGWDFNNIWYMSAYGTRPFLRMEHNYTVRTDHQLQMMDMDPTGDYTLENDIDLSVIKEPAQMWGTSTLAGTGFAPIGSSGNRFTGTFQGNGHVISNLFINRSANYLGLFGYADGGKIKEITLVDVNVQGANYLGSLIGRTITGIIENSSSFGNISGSASNVGGLIGYSTGMVKNCTFMGNVNGVSSIGGLIGYTFSPGEVSTSFAKANVTGTGTFIGGLVGRCYGVLSNSHSFSTVSGNNEIGGLVGEAGNTISDCYSIGNVTGSSNVGGLIGDNLVVIGTNFWNTETSGQVLSDGGTGKTTDEMMQQATFTGWDFGNTWGIIENFSFPYLRWQYPKTPQAVSGFAYVDFSNHIGLDKSVDLVHKGKHIVNEKTYTNGFYYFLVENNTFTSNDGVLVRIVNESIDGNTVFLANNSGSITNLITYGDSLTVISGSGAPMNISLVDQARRFLSKHMIYHASGGPLRIHSGKHFVLHHSTTFELDNDIITSVISKSYFYGHLILTKDIIFDGWEFHLYNLSGAHDLTVDGEANFHENVGEISKPINITVLGETIFRCHSINTIGYQKYSQPAYLTEDLQLSTGSGNGDVIFENLLDSYPVPFDLELDVGTGNVIFNNSVGADLITMGDIVVNSVHDLKIELDFHAQSFTQNVGTGTTDLGMNSLNLSTGSAIFKCNNLVGNITAGALSLKVKTANLTGEINGNTSQAGADEIVLLNVIKKGTQFFDGIDLYPFDMNYGTTVTEDSPYSVNYKTEYPIYAGYTWSMNTNAGSWLTFDVGTAVLSGTPLNGDVGTHWVNVTVDDGDGGVDWHHFDLVVDNVPTIITTIDPLGSILEDELYEYNFNCDDAGSGTINWSLNTNAGWLDINPVSGFLSGTPENDDVGLWWVNVTVDDGNSGYDSINYSIQVNNVNDAPGITTEDVTTTYEDKLYYVIYEANDIDPTGDTLTWSLSTNANWLKINATTANLSGTPSNDDVGSYWVDVMVSDGNGGITSQNFSLLVLNVNDAPSITTEDVTSAAVDELYSVDYEAIDIDPLGDAFTWSLKTNASWLSIETASGYLTGTPKKADSGTYWVEVTVGDGNGGFDSTNFTITVPSIPVEPPPELPKNKNPLITTKDDLIAEVDKLYSVDYDATDEDTPLANLSWSLTTNASWLSIDKDTGVLGGTPGVNDFGTFNVNVTVSDGAGGFASTNFVVTVKKPGVVPTENKKPKVSNGKMSPSEGDTETKFTFTVTYTDEDNDPGEVWIWLDGIKYEMTKDPNDDNNTDGVIYTYKTELDEGEHNYYFTADDGKEPAVAVDSTPIDTESAVSIPEIEKPGEQKEEDNLMTYMAILIIIMIIIILLVLAMSRRKKAEPSELEDDELEDEEPVDEELEDDELEDEEPVDEELGDEELEDEELEEE